MRAGFLVLVATFATATIAPAQRIVVESDDSPPRILPAQPDTPDYDLPVLERMVHAEVNAAREKHGLSMLQYDSDLASIGRIHSADMVGKGYFGHVSLSGATPSMRVARGGYLCKARDGSGVTENLYAGYFYSSYRLLYGESETHVFFDWKEMQTVAREIVEGWMNSPPHRANLIDPSRSVHGIGVIRSDDNEFFATQNLC